MGTSVIVSTIKTKFIKVKKIREVIEKETERDRETEIFKKLTHGIEETDKSEIIRADQQARLWDRNTVRITM